jgi:hypothetical protein
VSHEQRIEIRGGGANQSSANLAVKGGRGNGNSSNRGGGHGGFGCGRKGMAVDVAPSNKEFSASCARRKGTPSSGASRGLIPPFQDHRKSFFLCHCFLRCRHELVSELDKLMIHDKYHGGDQVHTPNGSGMKINHVGHGILHSPTSNLHLKYILHVLQTNKSLVYVNRFTRDNGVFLEFHPNHFCVKEQSTRKTLLKGRCECGLYPVKSSNKEVLGVVKPTTSLWHHHLGHASTVVVQQVLHCHQLPFARESNNSSVCDAC